MKRLVAGLALCLALSACGIGPGPVRSEGQAKSGELGATDTPLDLKRPSQTGDAVHLVEKFLEAPSVDANDRDSTLASYILPADRERWRAGAVTNVVRVIGKPTSRGTGDGTTTPVEVNVQYIGELKDGAIEPSARGTETLVFTVVNIPGEGVYLRAPKPDVLLSDRALNLYFDSRSLYFWSDTGVLVPDLRYVPARLSQERKADLLVQWLYKSPVSWLRPAAQIPSIETSPRRTVTQDDGILTVDLAKPTSNEEYAKLAKQLAKTLVVSPIRGLKLTTQGQEIQGIHVPTPEAERGVPRRYAVVSGSVVRLRTDDSRATDPVVGLGDLNKNVVLAGFTWGETAAFLAQQESDGLRLLIGLRPALVDVVLPGQTKRPKQVGQPFWLAPDAALVLADGRLYRVSLDGKAVQVQGVEGVSAMSVAADGTRIAMVVNGSLTIGALRRAGTGAISVQQQVTVPTMLAQVDGVAFGQSAKQELMVAGRDSASVRLVQMRVDGTEHFPYSQADNWQNSLQITHLVADPQSGTALFEIKGLNASFEAHVTKSDSLQGRIILSASATPEQKAARPSAPSFEG